VFGYEVVEVEVIEGYEWGTGKTIKLKVPVIKEEGITAYIDSFDDYSVKLNVVPRYSTDIVAAWEVVEKIKDPEAAFSLTYCAVNKWMAAFGMACVAGCDLASTAICHAALLAVMGGEDK